MAKIVYYVASSIDGFISGMNEDMSGFIYQSEGVEKYLKELESFKTVIMGRNTYEFGYKFGAKAGEPSPIYMHMKHYIFSNTLKFENQSDMVEIKKIDLKEVQRIKAASETDIYLCGGGTLAGWLLENEEINVLKIKLNPIILGGGVKIFENITKKYQLELVESLLFDKGLQTISYNITY